MVAWVINTWPLELEHDLTATEVGGEGVKADFQNHHLFFSLCPLTFHAYLFSTIPFLIYILLY